MHVELLNASQAAIARVNLQPKEEMFAHHGSLIAMSEGMKVQTLLRRGSETSKNTNLNKLSKLLRPKVLCLDSYRASKEGGEVFLAPALMGNIACYQLNQYKLIVRHSSYLASGHDLEIFMGYRSPVQMERSLWLNLVGKGDVLISSFGGIDEVMVDGKYTINFDHVVAFESTLKFQEFTGLKAWPRLLVPRQELLYEFHGTGRLFYQTHRPFDYAQRIGQEIKPDNFKLR